MRQLSVFDTFLTVSKEQSMTRAAKILGISQAAVSKQMKTLEEYLGFVLFESTTIPKRLNDDGKALLQIIKSYLLSLEKFKEERLSSSLSLRGHLSIMCESFCGNLAIKDILTDFGCMYPLVSVDFRSSVDSECHKSTSEGLFIILPTEQSIPGCVLIKNFPPSPLGLAVPKNIPLASKPYLSLDDIREHKLIVSNNLLASKELSSWLGIKKPYMLCDDWGMTQSMLMEGGGVAIVPLELQNQFQTIFKVIPLFPLVSIRLKMVYRSYKEMSLLDKTFARFVNT